MISTPFAHPRRSAQLAGCALLGSILAAALASPAAARVDACTMVLIFSWGDIHETYTWNTCSAPETCDGVDEDGDGLVDEGFDVGQSCPAQVLACDVTGVLRCDDDGGVICQPPIVRLGSEICDGIDNDCDGEVDNVEGAACVCVPGGAPIPCYDGPEGTEGVGVCHAGTKVCNADGTGFGACVGQTLPSLDVCEGALDEDCDGTVDELAGDCVIDHRGRCVQGARVCAGGVVTCEVPPDDDLPQNPSAWGPQLESPCDSLDDDGDGVIDETMASADCTHWARALAPGERPGGRGTYDAPWIGAGHALDMLEGQATGQVLCLHAGTYYERGLVLSDLHSGAHDAPFVLRADPDERAGPVVFEGSAPDIVTWQPEAGDGSGLAIYEAVDSSGSTEIPFDCDCLHPKRGNGRCRNGSFMGPDGAWHLLVPYANDGDAFAALATMLPASGEAPYYVGPGFHFEVTSTAPDCRARIRLRVEQADPAAIGDAYPTSPLIVPDEDGALDGGVARVSTSARAFDIDGAHHVVIHGVTLAHYDHAVRVAGQGDGLAGAGAHDGWGTVTLEDITFAGGTAGVLLASGAEGVRVSHSTFAQDLPSWVAWSDVKSRPYVAGALEMRGLRSAAIHHRVELCRNTFEGGFDGIVSTHGGSTELVVRHNTGEIVDEVVQLPHDACGLEFAYNRVIGPGVAHHGTGLNNPPGGRKYIHHNIIDTTRHDVLWRRARDCPEPSCDPYSKRPNPFTSHGWKLMRENPYKVYHNTAIYDTTIDPNEYRVGQIQTPGACDGVAPDGPDLCHEVYNNIFIQLEHAAASRRADVHARSTIYGGNVWAGRSTEPVGSAHNLFERWTVPDAQGDPVQHHFETLAELQDMSRAQAWDPPWCQEAVFVEIDPGDRDRPLPVQNDGDAPTYAPRGRAAGNTGVDLTGRSWPGLGLEPQNVGAIEP